MTDALRDPAAPLRPLTRRVVIEVPFQGETKAERNTNLIYLAACVGDCLLRGEAPIAIPSMIVAAVTPATAELIADEIATVWRPHADATVVYTDRGLTDKARQTKSCFESNGHVGTLAIPGPIEFREIAQWEEKFQAMPLYLAPGDAALLWEVEGRPLGSERIMAAHFGLAHQEKPLLFAALAFVVSNADTDLRLQREMVRFVDRINNIATEMRKRSEIAAKADRS